MTIAVLLPNYNHANYVGEAIDAIRRQSYGDWELAILDDCSTDKSRDVIAAHSGNDSRITIKMLQQNRGVIAALETCYRMTTAPIVIGVAADDVIVNPRFFEAVNAAFTAHPTAGCVFTRALLIDQNTGKEHFVMGKAPQAGWLSPRRCMRDFLGDRIFIHGGATAWSRSAVDRAGGFDPTLGPRVDYYLNHAVAAMGGAVFLDEISIHIRYSRESYGQSSSDDQTYFRQYAMLERKLMELDLGYKILPRWRRRWRNNVINERLANRWQKSFLDALREPVAALDPWHLPRFRPEIAEIATRLSAHAREWEEDIDRRVAAAEHIFENLAGQLPKHVHGFVHRATHPRLFLS